MTTQPARDPQQQHVRDYLLAEPETQEGHARDSWDVLFEETLFGEDSRPFSTTREQNIVRFVRDALFDALLDTDDPMSKAALNAIHAERRRRLSAATREERRNAD